MFNMTNLLYAFMQARNNGLSGSDQTNVLINGAIAPGGTTGLISTHLNVNAAIDTQKAKKETANVAAELDTTNRAFTEAIKHVPASAFATLLKSVEVDVKVTEKIKAHQPVQYQQAAQLQQAAVPRKSAVKKKAAKKPK